MWLFNENIGLSAMANREESAEKHQTAAAAYQALYDRNLSA
jgi:hypothetical protein